MSKTKVIELSGDISAWNISRAYAKYLADQAGQGELIVDLCSMGGDVNEALGIKKLFSDRGDVTLRYYGFNASAATIIGHGAAKTQIYEDAFYLIHKPLVWVDEWGRMNEDEIQQSIDNLQAQKKNAEAVTLTIAQDYVKNRGMEMKVVMDLMKEEKWLTAKEAVDLGLIDEVIPASTGRKIEVSNSMVAMMKANGFPELPSNSSEAEKEESLITKIINRINYPKQTQTKMRKDLTFVNQILGVEGVNENNGKVELTVEQILAFNNKLKSDSDTIVSLTSERDTAQNSLTDLNTRINALDATVANATTPEAKVAAITAKLASRPAAAAAAPAGGASNPDVVEDSVEWDTINDLAHNKEVDAMYFPPKTDK